MGGRIFTAEEVAEILKISKHTVYELIKRGELPAYKVGNMMRIDERDFDAYKESMKTVQTKTKVQNLQKHTATIQLSGSHDFLVEHLIKYINQTSSTVIIQPTYIGSLEGLMMLYRGQADVAAIHLLDATSQQYNIPFIKQFFVLEPITVVRLAAREQGFIVRRDNPKNIVDWKDLTRNDVKVINRQKGSGTRMLLDSFLAKEGIHPRNINGYHDVEWNHLAMAAAVQRGGADVAFGIRSAAEQLGLDFVPKTKEQFDLVLRYTETNKQWLHSLMDHIQSDAFQSTTHQLSGYDVREMGKTIYQYK